MRFKSILSGLCAVGVSSLLAVSALAEDAKLPYHLLYNAQKTRADLNLAHTNLLIVLTMQSTDAAVKSSDLSVYVDAKAGKIPVQIGAAGDFSVPMQDNLLDEDPWIVVNQPKGTMKLEWQVGLIPGRITNSVQYTKLMKPLRESQDVQLQIRRFFGDGPRRTVTGLKLTFTASQPHPVAVIHAKAGERKLEADGNHEIILPLAADLLNEDPEITLTEIPGAVEIVSHETTD
jgi:hypothetical protein